MPPLTIGILSPGDMGHTVGQVLKSHGLRVVACLHDRSERTRALAAQAGIESRPDYSVLVEEADILLSILVPARAIAAATTVADALSRADTELTFVDCNAVAPANVRAIGALITEAGGRFIDASIIGPPPRQDGTTRFYASGQRAADFATLDAYGLDIHLLGDEIGQASALKMCYAASTKGWTALFTTLLTVAHSLGVLDALMEEFELSQAATLKRVQHIPYVSRKARRFVGEMEEIANTFADAGLSPKMFDGAADIYRRIGVTTLADAKPEDTAPPPELGEMLQVLTAMLTPKS